jgi:restriction system protein
MIPGRPLMRSYYRILLGHKHAHADECFRDGFIGTDFGIHQDLTDKLPEEWRGFNKEFIPIYQRANPEKSKVSAGLACGTLWTVSKGIQQGDIILSPDGTGKYRVGEVTGGYSYVPGGVLFHRRPVKWLNTSVERSSMSDALRHSAGSLGTVSNITAYSDEIERLLGGSSGPSIVATDDSILNPQAFALEKHLQEFLVENWSHTELGRDFDIYEGGEQYETDTGPLDILAVSKDKARLLVVELKKGRASDAVVGQTLRYMSYVQEMLAENGQLVHGMIIALEDDQRIRRALAMTKNIEFYRYEVSFRLVRT